MPTELGATAVKERCVVSAEGPALTVVSEVEEVPTLGGYV